MERHASPSGENYLAVAILIYCSFLADCSKVERQASSSGEDYLAVAILIYCSFLADCSKVERQASSSGEDYLAVVYGTYYSIAHLWQIALKWKNKLLLLVRICSSL